MNACWTIQYCLNESLNQLLQHRMTIFAFAKLTFHTLIILLKLWHVHSVESRRRQKAAIVVAQ